MINQQWAPRSAPQKMLRGRDGLGAAPAASMLRSRRRRAKFPTKPSSSAHRLWGLWQLRLSTRVTHIFFSAARRACERSMAGGQCTEWQQQRHGAVARAAMGQHAPTDVQRRCRGCAPCNRAPCSRPIATPLPNRSSPVHLITRSPDHLITCSRAQGAPPLRRPQRRARAVEGLCLGCGPGPAH